MHSYLPSLESITRDNTHFRKVLYTSPHMQLVVMSLPPGGEIGLEMHTLDQFFRIEAGNGVAIVNGKEYALTDGSSIIIPQGTEHNIINRGATDLKLYTIYAPPNHKDGTTHATREDAEKDDEHFDGTVSPL